MGTNFYLKKNQQHIGKRSAAGSYCFDCRISLCKEGQDFVHWTTIPVHFNLLELGMKEIEWFKQCPICGKEPANENWESNSGGIELGFNKNTTIKKKGVASCSSFTWAILPYEFHKLFRTKKARELKSIEDEYGTKYSYLEFMDMLTSICPIQSYHSIGMDFS